MKKFLFIIICLFLDFCPAWPALYPENIFGLDRPVRHWGEAEDETFMGATRDRYLSIPTDAANLRIAGGGDTTDIILISDRGRNCLHWLRCSASRSSRQLLHISSTRGFSGQRSEPFRGIEAIAVAGTGPLYDPLRDHFFVADRMNHRIVKLKFEFYPNSRLDDRIIWESSTFIDSAFLPTDLTYVNFGTRNRGDNWLLALDDSKSRLALFNDNGGLVRLFNLKIPGDSLDPIFYTIAYRIENLNSADLFLADHNNSCVWRYRLSRHLGLEFVNRLRIGDRYSVQVEDVAFVPGYGLWAVDSKGSRIFQIAADLSQVNGEMNEGDFNPGAWSRPRRLAVFPERVVLIEIPSAHSGITSFAFQQPVFKENIGEPPPIPHEFGLAQNYPNPFNSNTLFRYSIPREASVTLIAYNVLGQKVAVIVDRIQGAGAYDVIWDASKYASGVYFAKLEIGEDSQVIKMVLLK